MALRNALGDLALDASVQEVADALAGVARDVTVQSVTDALAGVARDATVQAAVDRLAEVKAALPQDTGRVAVRLPSGQIVGLDAATVAALTPPAPPDVSGLATDARLAQVLTELAQKVEPADLAGLAQEGTLSALSGKVGVAAADDLLSLLRDIRANTAAETAAVDTLQLTADQVNLNTDEVEAKLDTVSARLGTTATAGTVAALLDAIRLNQLNQAVTATVANPTDVSALATNAKLEAVRALLAGTLTVDTELSAAGPLATELTLAAINAKLAGTLTVDTELAAAGPLALDATLVGLAGQLPPALSGGGRLLVDTAGGVASGAADAGNPVKIGGRYYSAKPTLVDGNRGDVTMDSRGQIRVMIGGSDSANSAGVTAASASGNEGSFSRFQTDSTLRVLDTTQGAGAQLLPVRSAESTTGGTGTGLLGVAMQVRGASTYLNLSNVSSLGDAVNLQAALAVAAWLYNGSTFDRPRNNTGGTTGLTLLASAARTATVSSADQTNYNGRGVHVIIDVTAVGTGGLTVRVQEKMPTTKYVDLLVDTAAITAVGTYMFEVYPGAATTPNDGVRRAASRAVARTWRVTVTHADGSSWTYSVEHAVIM